MGSNLEPFRCYLHVFLFGFGYGRAFTYARQEAAFAAAMMYPTEGAAFGQSRRPTPCRPP
jgi:hypothetical protein